MKSAVESRLIFRIALRNLWLYRLKTLVIGALLGAGAFLAVLGLSLLHDVEASMKTSIIDSVAGHMQIYSNKAKDDLAVFGSMTMSRADIGTIPDLAPLHDEVMKNPNVAAFVPMGFDMSIISRGNELDDTLDALRTALKSKDPAIIQNRADQLRFQLQQLKRELAEQRKILADLKEVEQHEKDIATVEAPGFLDDLRLEDEQKLQFLETKIAPISGEKQPLYLYYCGTDIDLYRQNFSKFKVVQGEVLPTGQRGIMLGQKVRETQLKNLVARIFDRLQKRVFKNQIAIKGDAENERDAADLPRQYTQVMSFLDHAEAQDLSTKLEAFGIKGEGDDLIPKVTAQLKSFLTVDDANLQQRFDWFYANIAPKIRLYEINPGETITLRSYTRSGYIKSLPLKVYGVFSFAGLEDSDLAGAVNIIDLVSFRELYGQQTEASKKELEDMRAAAGIKDVAQDNAEDALFGAGASKELETRSLEATAGKAMPTIQVKPTIPNNFDTLELGHGLALDAAVKLKDPDKQAETEKELADALKDKGFDVRIVDWQKSSGIVGQFVNIVRLALMFAIIVIFAVALVIINNGIIVSTYNRIREIGTMRAIGAQRTFVLGLFLAETGITGFIGAVVGTVAATLLLATLHKSGIPAGNDVVTFLFSGPRLYPNLRWSVVAEVPILITIVATLTSIYAARHAAKVKPAEAMQEKE
jgi:ABC-type lipoprotein release transport system permease subunit